MKIKLIASDSMGTRSMATYLETDDIKIFIDPGVALGPSRYGLPPHPLEFKRLDEHWEEIVRYARKAEVLILTHYHYDHHSPWEDLDIYEKKTVLIKHPTEKINLSQKRRAAFFLEAIKNLPEKLDYCDGKEYVFGETKIRFSKPVFHGTNPKLGFVVEVLVDNGKESFLFTSDVEGPSIKDQIDFIVENKPNIVYLDGPMTYMLGYRFSYKSLEESVKGIIKIVEECPIKELIVDHHLLRDLEWDKRIAEPIKKAEEKNIRVKTAAEFAGKPLDMLEAHRKELYKKYPVGKEEIKTRKKISSEE